MSLLRQGQNSTAGNPYLAAARIRSRKGSFPHHISTFTANRVWGVLPIEPTSAWDSSALNAPALPAKASAEPKNVRRSKSDILLPYVAYGCLPSPLAPG